MSVITADFVERLSGGASNSDGNASLGGVKSSNTKSSTVDAFFDAVSAAEAAAGRVDPQHLAVVPFAGVRAMVPAADLRAAVPFTGARAIVQQDTP